MAIYSLHHQPIGKTTQDRPHTSAAHVRYITRPSAASHIETGRMPETPRQAQAFMVEAEDRDRKNARVADKILLALPVELDAAQRAELVRGYAEEVTQGRASWLAAFHDKGKDAHNPHAHLLIRDRDPATGKRVAELSEKGSTERLRSLWEDHANRALERAGRGERIDRRTLEAQGIAREPTVHEGPRSQQMERRGARPESRLRRFRNRPGSRLPHRQVDYRNLDRGRSRPEYNRHIRETPGEYWQAVDADNQGRELDALRAIHHPPLSLDVEGSVLPRERLLVRLPQTGVDAVTVHLPIEIGVKDYGETLLLGLDPSPVLDLPLPDDRKTEIEGPDPDLGGAKPIDEIRNHDLSIFENTHISMGNAMDEKDRILAQHDRDVENKEFAHNSSQTLLSDTMKRAFYDPDASMEKMNIYARKKNNREALYEKLRDKEEVFGRRPGSMLSKDGFQWGSGAKRRDADIARHNLPIVLKQADTDREAWHNAKRARDDARARYGIKPETKEGPAEGQVPNSARNPGAQPSSGPAGGRPGATSPNGGPSNGPSPAGAASGRSASDATSPKPAQGAQHSADPTRATPASAPVSMEPEDIQKRREQAAEREKTAARSHPATAKTEPQSAKPTASMEPDDLQKRREQAAEREKSAARSHPATAKTEPQPAQPTVSMAPGDVQKRREQAAEREKLTVQNHPGYSQPQPSVKPPSKSSFSDRIRQPGTASPPQRSGSFSDKLAAMRNSPQQARKGSPARGRDDEIER